MYHTDRGLEELEERRGHEEFTFAWLAATMRAFIDTNPQFEDAIDRLATHLARNDQDD